MNFKIKRIPLMVISILTIMVIFSTIAYAEFTRQYNPAVDSFGVSVSSQENMMISATGKAETFTDYLKLEELVSDKAVTLTPLKGTVTSTADETYKSLTLRDSLGNVAVKEEKKYEEFDLYFLGTSDMNLYLAGSERGEVIVLDDNDYNVHFTQTQRDKLIKNMRVAILTYATTYQTLGGVTTPVYSNLPISVNIYSKEQVVSDDYNTFTQLGFSNTNADTILASTKRNEVTKVKVVIWLENEGLDGLEAICDLTLSIRFQAVLKKEN